MSDFQIKWRNRSFYDLRSDPAVVRDLERRGRSIVAAANRTLPEGTGYRMSSFQGKKKPQGRWFVNVYTSSNHAKRSEARRNTLVRVVNQTQGVTASQLQDFKP